MKNNNEDNQNIINNFEAQFKKSTLPLIILSMLKEKDMYAYEIMQATLSKSHGKYKMPLLYVALGKLQEQGFVKESRKEVSKDNRVRIYYGITDSGIKHLELLKSLFFSLSDTVKDLLESNMEG